MDIKIDNKITLTDIPEDLLDELKNRLSFINPAWIENDRLGYWNGQTPHTLKYYELDNGEVTLPRGFIRHLINLCGRFNVEFHIEDARRVLDNVKFNFKGELRGYQEDAVAAILPHDFGVLSSPPGSGKTTMALFAISERRQPTLIIVHTKELLNQWVSRIEQFLGIPKQQIGIIGGGQKKIGEQVTVALIQSLYKCAHEVSPYIGFLVVDEVHHCPSRTFTEAVSCFDSKYQLGLSATVYRRDQLTRLIFWYLGDQVHKVERDDLVKKGHVLPFEVISRETAFQTSYNASEEYSKMLSELTRDSKRNALIVSDVVTEANNGGGTCLILSDRKQHCETFKVLLRGHGIKAELLTGDVSGKDREDIVDRLNNGKVKVLISTTQLLGEGFDSKQLTTLFMASPIKFSGRVIQTVGRILRPMPGKQARIYDYVDSKVGVLRASFESRQRVYSRGCVL